MARILIVTYSMYGSWFSLQLQEEGHSVDIWLQDNYDDYSGVLSGIVKTPLRAKPDFKKYDLVLFDLTGRPALAEDIMKTGIPVIGDGDFNSEIEEDRLLGIEIMEKCDIDVPFYETFDDLSEAKRFIKQTNKRFVFKPFGGQEQDTASTYVSESAGDLLRYLDKLGGIAKGAKFILQEVVYGTEVSTEAWFNGEEFFLVNGTLEEKKFMNGNKGPNTGCSGNLVWIYDEQNPPLVFREGLAKMQDFLQEVRYVGMIDLNTIANDSGKLYGLEWTPRFGYDASATLFSCLNDCLGNFMGAIGSTARPEIQYSNIFAASVRLSIPPYPSEIKRKHPDGVPIENIKEEEIIKHCFLYDCCAEENGESLVTAGINGLVCCPIRTGGTGREAWDKINEAIKNIKIPDCQYRTDIDKTTLKRYEELARSGWLR